MDLLNSVGRDTSTQRYYQDKSGNAVSAGNRSVPQETASPSPRIPMLNMPPSPLANASFLAAQEPAPTPKEQFQSGLPTNINPSSPVSPNQAFASAKKQMADFASGVSADTPNVLYGSGKKATANDKLDYSTKAVNTMATMLTPEQYLGARENFDTNPEVGDLRNNKDLQRKIVMAGLQNYKPQADLSVLKDFAKNISDGRYTMDGYTAPKAPITAESALALLQGEDKNSLALLKQAQDAIEGQKAGTYLEGSALDVQKATQDVATDPKLHEKVPKPLDTSKHVAALQKEMKDIQPLITTYNQLEKMIEGAIGSPLSKWDGIKDIPGIGKGASMAAGPLRLFLSDKGANIKDAYQALKNHIIYSTSGQQINEAEGRRLSDALGGGFWSDDRQAIAGMARFKEVLKDIAKQREARVKGIPGLGPQVMKDYKAGGGTLSEDIKSPDYGADVIADNVKKARSSITIGPKAVGTPKNMTKERSDEYIKALRDEQTKLDAELQRRGHK